MGRCPKYPKESLLAGCAHRREAVAVCVFLALAVALVFGQTLRHEFVNYDDNEYVYENPRVTGGLNWRGIQWAFTHRHSGNWHPLTGLSHQLDCQLYGLQPWGHHLSNVLLHGATAVLLFLILWRMTGALWPSAFAAALFAVHPLRVESVAWVSERKDVLSGLFFVLTLGAYERYVRRGFSAGWYLAALVLFALGLMAKPMLVTLPFVLLLLDYWPLNRMESSVVENDAKGGAGESAARLCFPARLAVEKIPFFILVGVSCVLTLWAQQGALMSQAYLPLKWRLGNAVVACGVYLRRFFLPVDLSVVYVHPYASLPLWNIGAAAVVLVLVTAAALIEWRRRPCLLIGWLWFLGMLAPVIGVVQVGRQAMADRYTYLPQIGLCLALAWGTADLFRSWPARSRICAAAAGLALAASMACAWRQTGFWRDSETLWTRALATPLPDAVAWNNLGLVLAGQGQTDVAMSYFRKAQEIDPRYTATYNNLGIALRKQGRLDEAMDQFAKALAIDPRYAEAHNNLGIVLGELGRLDEATERFRAARDINPDYAEAHCNLGVALAKQGWKEEAVAQFQAALRINPGYEDARRNLNALQAGQP